MNRARIIFLLSVLGAFLSGCSSSNGGPPPAPVLMISATSASFLATQGAAGSTAPAPIDLSNSGTGTLAFSAASDAPWLTVTPTSGAAPQTLQVSAAAGTLAPGMYAGHVTVTASGAAGSPATVTVSFLVAPPPSNSPLWAQWGANAQHTGAVDVAGQALTSQLADIVFDPFVNQQKAENVARFGEAVLTVHYQAPITDGNDVYMLVKSGSYTSCNPAGAWTSGTLCGPNTWETMVWNEARFSWIDDALTRVWTFQSDWKPPPNGSRLSGWEPVFHPADASDFVYVPGAGGTVWKVNKADGTSAAHINPFTGTGVVPASTFVAGPLTADAQGNIYYNVIELADPALGDVWKIDARGAWLVKVTPADMASIVPFATLVPGAPAGVGIQRAGINVAPAVATDGTVYTVSAAHLDRTTSFLVAVNSNLTPKWAASMRDLPIGAGGALGSARLSDLGSSSPTVLPDGSVLFGTISTIIGSRGNLFHFDALGAFLGSYDFGWDSTPAVYVHGGTFSIIIKDNYYSTSGPFYITQLDANLNIEWRFLGTNTQSCMRNPDGSLTCVDDHPGGFEWCINMPAVDANGVVYANSEDGNLFALPQGNSGIFTVPLANKFLNLALGAAYTPLALGPDGKIYTQNNGHLFVVGD